MDVLLMKVGRMASWASCALLLFVLYCLGFEYPAPKVSVIYSLAVFIARDERFVESVLMYVMNPDS